VNDVKNHEFEIMLIPHTLVETTFGKRAIGGDINLEIDLIARYLARMREMQSL
jgi:riboflavin synthase